MKKLKMWVFFALTLPMLFSSNLAYSQIPGFDCSSPSMTQNWVSQPNRVFLPCPQVNVGIGNEHPTANLHVFGSGIMSSLETYKIMLGTAALNPSANQNESHPISPFFNKNRK